VGQRSQLALTSHWWISPGCGLSRESCIFGQGDLSVAEAKLMELTTDHCSVVFPIVWIMQISPCDGSLQSTPFIIWIYFLTYVGDQLFWVSSLGNKEEEVNGMNFSPTVAVGLGLHLPPPLPTFRLP
jgi:hypothetical protein